MSSKTSSSAEPTTHLTAPGLAADIAEWARSHTGVGLPASAVPGANKDELRQLAALGSFARSVMELRLGEAEAGAVIADLGATLGAWLTPGASATPPEELVSQTVHALNASHAGDVLATVYEQLVHGPRRRYLGTFFTPSLVVDHMTTLCEKQLPAPPDVVADPGAGVGAFTLAGRATWPNATVRAVDVNVVTLGLLAARGLEPEAVAQTEYILADYMEWLAEPHPSAGPVLTLGNPPYTRAQHMSEQARLQAQEVCGGLVTSRLAGLSTYFLAGILAHLRPQDSTCLLLPGNWMYTRYGREVREWLWQSRHRHVRLQVFPATVQVFPGTRVTAMVLFVGPHKTRKQKLTVESVDLTLGRRGHTVKVLEAAHVGREAEVPASFAKLLQAVAVPTSLTNDGNPAPALGRGRRGPGGATAGKATGTANSMSTGVRAAQGLLPAEGGWGEPPDVPLADIAVVRRGVATGANHFFFLTDAQRDSLGAEFTLPAVVRAADVPGRVLDRQAHAAMGRDGVKRWLLRLGTEAVDDPAVRAYLAEGVGEGLNLRHLATKRRPWFNVEHVSPPDLFVSPFLAGRVRVIVNEVGAVPSNNLYGLTVRSDSGWTTEGLASWLASDEGHDAVLDQARLYQGGSYKVEPRELQRVRVPSPPLSSVSQD